MSKRNHLHSFTLTPEASQIITEVRNGKKSLWASRAITWFGEPREFIIKKHTYTTTDGEERKYTRRTGMIDLSELIEGNEKLQERLSGVCIELRDLKLKRQSFIGKIANFLRK